MSDSEPNELEEAAEQHELNLLYFAENNLADDDDEAECDQEALKNSLWLISFKPPTSKLTQKDNAGKAVGYLKLYPAPNSNKLKLARIPKQTAFSRRVKQKKAAGGNDIRNYFAKPGASSSDPAVARHSDPPALAPDPAPPAVTLDPAPIDSHDLEAFGIVDNPALLEAENIEIARERWIEENVNQYRLKPKELQPSALSKIHLFEQQWEQLEHAINQATIYYKSQQKKQPHSQFPTSELGEIREFNIRRRELGLAGTKSPAIMASVMTAQSCIRREVIRTHLVAKVPSGIGQSRRIRLQAQHLIDFNKLQEAGRGLSSPHTSMLDDERVSKALLLWASSAKPGEVITQFFLPPNFAFF